MTTVAEPITARLTRRQYEIMRLKLDGVPNREIAAQLCISLETVRTTVVNAYDRIEDAGWYPPGTRSLSLLIIAVMSGQVRLEIGSPGRYAFAPRSEHD